MGKRKKESLSAVNTGNILREKITVDKGGKTLKLHPLESGLKNLISDALKGNMRAMKLVINECLKAGILETQVKEHYHPSGLTVPKHWDEDEWKANYDKYGYPPWPGDDDGFFAEDREEYEYWCQHGHHSWRDRS